MINYYSRTPEQQKLIDNAYRFEIEKIENLDCSPNPYRDEIFKLEDGVSLWLAIDEAVEMRFHN